MNPSKHYKHAPFNQFILITIVPMIISLVVLFVFWVIICVAGWVVFFIILPNGRIVWHACVDGMENHPHRYCNLMNADDSGCALLWVQSCE